MQYTKLRMQVYTTANGQDEAILALKLSGDLDIAENFHWCMRQAGAVKMPEIMELPEVAESKVRAHLSFFGDVLGRVTVLMPDGGKAGVEPPRHPGGGVGKAWMDYAGNGVILALLPPDMQVASRTPGVPAHSNLWRDDVLGMRARILQS